MSCMYSSTWRSPSQIANMSQKEPTGQISLQQLAVSYYGGNNQGSLTCGTAGVCATFYSRSCFHDEQIKCVVAFLLSDMVKTLTLGSRIRREAIIAICINLSDLAPATSQQANRSVLVGQHEAIRLADCVTMIPSRLLFILTTWTAWGL